MMYLEELNEFEIGISEIFKKILPQIQAKSVGPDYVLDDTNKEFEKFFLNTANHRLTDAYQNYVFGSRAERERNRVMQTKMIKTEEIIEIEDDSNESEIVNENLVQSTTGDWDEYDTTDWNNRDDESIHTTQVLISTTTASISQPIQLQNSFNGLKFQCNYCPISHADIDGIYKHWTHAFKHADAYQAFQFHIEMIGACFNCNKNGTFNELKQHFKDEHPGLDFGAVNISDKMKCFICDFSGKNMAEHFKTHHTMAMQMDSMSPIRIQTNILDELKALRVQKKFKCDCCDNVVYDTKDKIIEHYQNYSMNHDIKRSPFIEIFDEQPTLVICGFCQITFDESEMQDHLQNHQIDGSNCRHFDGNVSENHPGIYHLEKEKLEFGIAYYQTKLIHCNGLTLTYANVLGPNDDENEKIHSFFTVTSPKCTHQSILRSPPDESNNYDSPILNCNSPVASLNDSILMSPRSTGSKSDPNDPLREDLLLQRSYLDTLVIIGLPTAYMDNDKHLMTMFVSLCIHLEVPIVEDEISSIYSLKNELIVKLHSRKKKENIIKAMISKYRWPHVLKSDALVKIPPNVIPETIYVNPKLTKHFHQMWMKAKFFRKQKKIHSFRLSSGGIAIQINRDDKEVYAKSFEDLDNFVNETSGSTPPSSKRKKRN